MTLTVLAVACIHPLDTVDVFASACRLALVVFILIIGQEISTERFIRVFVRDYALQIFHALRLAVRVFTLLFQYILDLLLSWSIHFPVVFKF